MERFEILTPLEFSESVERTTNGGISLEDVINNCCISLMEEFGEFCGVIKKWKFHGHELDLELVKKELGDILFYSFWLCRTITTNSNYITFSQLFTRSFKDQSVAIPGGSSGNLAQQFYHAQEDLGRVISTGFVFIENKRYGHDVYRFKQMIEVKVLTFLRSITAICCNLELDEHLYWGNVAHLNKQKLMRRYPDGFSEKASKERTE